jgi:hypothetical protein
MLGEAFIALLSFGDTVFHTDAFELSQEDG